MTKRDCWLKENAGPGQMACSARWGWHGGIICLLDVELRVGRKRNKGNPLYRRLCGNDPITGTLSRKLRKIPSGGKGNVRGACTFWWQFLLARKPNFGRRSLGFKELERESHLDAESWAMVHSEYFEVVDESLGVTSYQPGLCDR